MSTTGPSQTGHDPTSNSHQPGPAEPENFSFTVDLPPDPLLDFGSFIAANPSTPTATSTATATAFNDQTLNKRAQIGNQQSSAPATSNGAAESATTPQKTPQRRSTESATTPEKSQQRRSSAAASTESWSPHGWIVEDRVRSSGATAGTVDKYYFDPVSGRRFRSKKEVLYFLEFGTKPKRKKENSDTDMESSGSSGSSKQKKSGVKGKTSASLNFDYFNAPEKIEWVLSNDSKDSWTPFIGKNELPESVRQDWVVAFASSISDGHQATI